MAWGWRWEMNAGQRGGSVFVLASPSDRRSGDTRAERWWNGETKAQENSVEHKENTGSVWNVVTAAERKYCKVWNHTTRKLWLERNLEKSYIYDFSRFNTHTHIYIYIYRLSCFYSLLRYSQTLVWQTGEHETFLVPTLIFPLPPCYKFFTQSFAKTGQLFQKPKRRT